MKLRHLVTVAAMAAGLCAAGAAPASADYPITQADGTVSDSTLAPGQAETFCGGGFAPNAIVRIFVDAHVVGSAPADGSGSFCTTLRITSPGSHVIMAKGTG